MSDGDNAPGDKGACEQAATQAPNARRTGDTVSIPGDYQARALREGCAVQRFWHTRKTDLIERVCPAASGLRVLDVGCGSGVVANYLAQQGAAVDAVDANPSAIEYARANAATAALTFHLGLVDATLFEAGTFDRIYCLELIEHLAAGQAEDLMRRLAAMLKPGGQLLVTTPNCASLWPIIEWTMDTFGLAPRMLDDQHVTRLTLGDLRRMAGGGGLDEIRIGRFCGVAPFVSAASWRAAMAIDRVESRMGNPLGNLLYACGVAPGEPRTPDPRVHLVCVGTGRRCHTVFVDRNHKEHKGHEEHKEPACRQAGDQRHRPQRNGRRTRRTANG